MRLDGKAGMETGKELIMKLKKEFIVHNQGEESLMVATSSAAFSGLVRGNKTLGTILELLKKETSQEDLVRAMRARFEAPEGVIERDVETVLEKLRSIGALDE